MSKRRKGEQPVPLKVVGWSDDHAVAHSMKTGTPWFSAWIGQMCTPFDRLRKRTGIRQARLAEIEDGATFTRAELEALARAWLITPEGLFASMPDPERVIG